MCSNSVIIGDFTCFYASGRVLICLSCSDRFEVIQIAQIPFLHPR
jgi:hypothetical protein